LCADAIVAATGFSAQPTISFEPQTIHADLGLPSTGYDESQHLFWSGLDSEADVAIGSSFPHLLAGPCKPPGSSAPQSHQDSYTPWRLYRGIAPPGLTSKGDRSLVFLGMFSNVANTIRLEVQCLWALAYLERKLPSLGADSGRDKVFKETAIFQRFTHHRAPYGHGRFYPDLVFDQLPYWDVLLNDLGLSTRRKANGFLELFAPYTQEDYQGIAEEWARKNK